VPGFGGLVISFVHFSAVKSIFKVGDKKKFRRTVRPEDTAAFESGEVHPVYATFALARDAEWCSRLFVLEMKEAHEEGIGTFVNIRHLSPALTGQEVIFEATIEELKGNEVNCYFTAKVGERIIAEGKTGQKILNREKLDSLFAKL
jgi:fluoroacetyl-CoA thioesterase